MRVQVAHVTRLDYTVDVTEAVVDARLGPLDDAHQRVDRFDLRLEPAGHVRRYVDGHGNAAHLLTATRPHPFLQLTAETEVLTYLHDPFRPPSAAPRPLEPAEALDYLDPSPLVPRLVALEEMAAPFRPSHPTETFECARRISELINRQLAYRQNVTDVGTTVEQVLAGREGVCQDFTHLMIGLCRAVDIPARYVSGYIVIRPPGRDSPSRGAGASHAWAEVYTPTHGWRGFDPTNDLVANQHYVKVAVGRDYRDIPPTRGTFRGSADERLSVDVSTRVLD